MPANVIDELIHPRSIAIAGTINRGFGGGMYIDGLQEFGFKGKIYLINPNYQEFKGLKCYPDLKSIPGMVDYLISSIPAREVLPMLEEAALKNVKLIQLFTARLAETGRPEAIDLEQRITKSAKEKDIRLMGPNCLGLHYPAMGISWLKNAPKQSGMAGLASQSGMLAAEIILTSRLRGIYFSKAFSFGNAIDLNESDYLDYLSHDSETKLIMMYIEGVKDGQRFFRTLRQATALKPVIILKGGKSESGARATTSHTASLAGSLKTWDALIDQSGAVSADSLEELFDIATSFYFLPSFTGRRVGVGGGTGGTSVLAADECEKAGLEVIPLSKEFREELKRRGISVWDWLSNPADFSIRDNERLTVGLIMELMAKDVNFDLLITLLGMPGGSLRQPGTTMETYLEQQYNLEACREKPFLAVVADKSLGIKDWTSDEWKTACETRQALINLKIPFYPTIARAALSARKVTDYYRYRRQNTDD